MDSVKLKFLRSRKIIYFKNLLNLIHIFKKSMLEFLFFYVNKEAM